MDENLKKQLQRCAYKIRMDIIESIHAAGSGHTGGSLSAAEILAYLYFKEMNIDPKNPEMENRDRFVLSKGHAAPVLYATLAERGFFPKEELLKLRRPDSFLQGHPDKKHTPGVDISSGSLGQGVSAACGMALSSKHFRMGANVYALLGDGELEEGEVWEAAMFAGNKNLSNLTLFIDYNGLQIDGPIKEVNSAEPIDEKFRAFNFHVISINGNDIEEIDKAVTEAHSVDKPVAIVCHTVKGKGVSFMENQASWHGKAPNDEQYAAAMEELRAAYDKI